MYASIALGGFYLYFAYNVYVTYEREFGGIRLSRTHENSPSESKRAPPDIKPWQANKERVLHNANLHENFRNCELLQDLKVVDFEKKTGQNLGKYAKHMKDKLKDGKAAKLDMDHVYISYFELLWAMTWIGPFSYMYWKQGTIKLRIRVYLVKKGLLKKKEVDLSVLVAKIVLEQSHVVHYYARTENESRSKLGNVACFFFADFSWVDIQGKYQVADLLAIDIDLDTKKMVKCKMDDEILNPQEAVNVIWYGLISYQHVKLHSFANWGVNCDEHVKKLNSCLHRNSLITVIYNYFGFSSFPTFMKGWESDGLLSENWDPKSLTACFVHGAEDNIWQHGHIVEMQPYSEFVRFVVNVRAIFLSEFTKYKHLFPDVHGEALFVGTVLHSLDHALMDWNMEDALWLDVDDPKYGKMAEMGRIVKAGFAGDVPGFYFNRRFKGSGHPFYESVYRKAAKINKKFADNMDTCICR